MRERRQPAAGARGRAPARNRHPAGDRRVATPHHRAVAHGKPAARTHVRWAGLRHFTARARSCHLRGDEHHAARPRRRSSRDAARDWRVALFLVAGAIVSTMFFALAPALQATRLELVRAVRGEVVRDARPGRARNVLVGLQVTASVLLLICSAVFLRSALATATIEPGIRAADAVMVDVPNEQIRSAVLEAVRRDPSVTSVAASWPGALGSPRACGLRRSADVGGTRASRRSATSSSRRNSSACLASTSYADAASRRPSGAQALRSRSCRKASRASYGPIATRSGNPAARAGSEERSGRPMNRLSSAHLRRRRHRW